MTETPSNRHDDIGTSPRCPTKVIENKPICLCFPCCTRDLSCLDLALLPHASRHVLDRHKFPGGRPPYKSNFYCHPGRAGGTPMLLGALLMAQKRPREAIVPLEDAACRSANPELETYLAIALRVGDGMGLDVDPRSERCVLRFDRRPRRATHVGGHELHIHARCVDDDKAADKRDDDETPRP